LTLGAAIIGYFLVLSFPDIMLNTGKRQGFTARQLAIVLDRVQRDRGDANADPLSTKKVLNHMKAWPLWVYGFMFLTSSVPIYAFAYFIQIILGTMGYSKGTVFLLCAPPYICSAVWTVTCAWLADRSKMRMPWMVLNAAITFTGLLLTAYHHVSIIGF
jgi:cyanate permease